MLVHFYIDFLPAVPVNSVNYLFRESPNYYDIVLLSLGLETTVIFPQISAVIWPLD